MTSHKKPNLFRIALWIKEYEHPIRVIAGLLLSCGLIAGIFWLMGFDAEPTAFMFVTISSILFSSPSVASYFAPDRKPVRYMNFDELLGLVLDSNPTEDWHTVHTESSEEAFLREDPRLRIRVSHDEDLKHSDNFVEPWANRFPHKTAWSRYYDLSYESALIERFILVAVDGGRARLPLPKSRDDLSVDPLKYRVAQIFDSLSSLDDYMERAELFVGE